MTIGKRVAFEHGGRKLTFLGDIHVEDGTDLYAEDGSELPEADALISEISTLVDGGGFAFLELGAHQLNFATQDGGEKGLYYRMSVRLNNAYRNNPRVTINDIRATNEVIPIIAWASCSNGIQNITQVTWKNIDERFDAARNGIDELAQQAVICPVLTAAALLLNNILEVWDDIKEDLLSHSILLEHNLLPMPVAVRANNVSVKVMQRLNEVGLLCDMHNWLTNPQNENSNAIVFCGAFHVELLQPIFIALGWTITSTWTADGYEGIDHL
jgi:hypothetical protein